MKNSDTLIGIVNIATLSLLMPLFLRTIDYVQHHFRRWRQTVNARTIVHSGVAIFVNRPEMPDSVYLSLFESRAGIYQQMIFSLNVLLDYSSANLPYEKKKFIKDLCYQFDSLIIQTPQGITIRPNTEILEALIFSRLKNTKWLKLGACPRTQR